MCVDEERIDKKAKKSLTMAPKKIFLGSLIITVMAGCYSNEICIDPSHRAILNPSHHDLYRLRMVIQEEESGKTSYLELSLSDHRHQDKFYLTEKNPDFEVIDYSPRPCSFHLRPNTVYSITNSSNGDAAANSVTFQTDSFNNIFAVEGTSCKL